jgi:hypothetical protein
MSCFKFYSFDSNGQEVSQRVVNTVTGHTAADDWTQINAAFGRFYRGIFTLK